MINYNNHNITGISYNNHSIKYVYGCGGNLVWSGETPPVFDLKLYAEYTTSETLEIECNGQRLDPLEPQHGGDPDITYMEKVYIGGCAKSIPQNTFSNMAINLKEVIMYDGITTIYNNSFSELYKLSKVTIPSSVTSIGSRAFYGCSGLTSVIVEAITPPTLGSGAFDGSTCPIYVPCQSVDAYKTAWSRYADRIACVEPAFNGKWKATYSDSHTESAECGSSSAISRYEIENLNLVSVEVGNCVTSLANEAFMLSVSLTSITLPDGLTSIGNNTFDDCASLTGITIPNSVTNIGEYAFDTCSGLTTVNIPSGVTNIKQSTFYSCSGLTSIDIPSGVTTIGTYAFGYCSNLTTVTVNAITPPTADYGVFFKTSDALVIYVPDESVNAYKAARNWSTYADRIKPISEKP